MIDKNRPQIIRTTSNGVNVVEFKDQPGDYFDGKGNAVPDTTARAAGYDVEAGKRERRRRELEREARERVEKQIQEEFEDIDERVEKEFADGGLRVAKVGSRWGVIDADDRVLVEDLTKREAEDAFEDLRTRGERS